ncbi:MAG: glycosyltransferase family 4 protein [Epsilonproteobacteria bacterium]|nr:glycosyltransferase family 4 protein [Campylobacterota bacterium]
MAKKIKVLHTEWSDGWGGQEIRIINEMIAVRQQGVEVCLACRDHAQIKQKAIQNNIEVFILPFRGNFDFSTMFSLKKIIEENNIDIVNTHSGKDTWVGGFAAKLAKVKFIRTRHLSNMINPSRLNFINELADFIFTTGESVKENMIKYNRIKPERILSVPTGIDGNIFNPKKYNKKQERDKLGLKDDEIAIGIVAVLRSFKRHDLFIEAAEILSKKYNNLKFFIVGDGPKKKEMETLVCTKKLQNRVIFLGHINEPSKILCALDIFALTSDSKEGVPQSIIQALLMNKKVLATDAGSTKDLYKNSNFLIAKKGSLSAIVNGLDELINDNSQTEKNSRDYINKNFSQSVMVEKIINVYRNMVLK